MRKKPKRIDSTTSRTAEMTCVSRAASYCEKNPCYKSNDYIAPKLLPGFMLPLIKMSVIRNLYKSIISPKGIYEYVIARTKYIDTIFVESLENDFQQVVIFGAGFDSRGLRFVSKYPDTTVFELDVPITQSAKLTQLQKKCIPIPGNINFISINFNKEAVFEKLLLSGFNRKKKTLFLLEGLLMYLDSDSVEKTFKTICDNTKKGSEIVFDFIYASVLRKEYKYYGEKDIAKYVSKAGEGWTFGIEEGNIESFLKAYSLMIKEKKNSIDLENLYFKNCDGVLQGKINGTHCIVRAVV